MLPCGEGVDVPLLDNAEDLQQRLEVDVGKRLGGGATGRVYQATFDGQEVALKVTHPNLARKPEQINAFLKEARLLARLAHSNVIRVLAVCHLPPAFCGLPTRRPTLALVLELGKLGTLSSVIKSCTSEAASEPVHSSLAGAAANGAGEVVLPLSTPSKRGFSVKFVEPADTASQQQVYSDTTAVSWCLDIARALHFLHTRNPSIIHRDVKPDNILLVENQNVIDGGLAHAIAKLADFGLHVEVDSVRGDQMVRRVASAVGSASQDSRTLSVPRSVSSYITGRAQSVAVPPGRPPRGPAGAPPNLPQPHAVRTARHSQTGDGSEGPQQQQQRGMSAGQLRGPESPASALARRLSSLIQHPPIHLQPTESRDVSGSGTPAQGDQAVMQQGISGRRRSGTSIELSTQAASGSQQHAGTGAGVTGQAELPPDPGVSGPSRAQNSPRVVVSEAGSHVSAPINACFVGGEAARPVDGSHAGAAAGQSGVAVQSLRMQEQRLMRPSSTDWSPHDAPVRHLPRPASVNGGLSASGRSHSGTLRSNPSGRSDASVLAAALQTHISARLSQTRPPSIDSVGSSPTPGHALVMTGSQGEGLRPQGSSFSGRRLPYMRQSTGGSGGLGLPGGTLRLGSGHSLHLGASRLSNCGTRSGVLEAQGSGALPRSQPALSPVRPPSGVRQPLSHPTALEPGAGDVSMDAVDTPTRDSGTRHAVLSPQHTYIADSGPLGRPRPIVRAATASQAEFYRHLDDYLVETQGPAEPACTPPRTASGEQGEQASCDTPTGHESMAVDGDRAMPLMTRARSGGRSHSATGSDSSTQQRQPSLGTSGGIDPRHVTVQIHHPHVAAPSAESSPRDVPAATRVTAPCPTTGNSSGSLHGAAGVAAAGSSRIRPSSVPEPCHTWVEGAPGCAPPSPHFDMVRPSRLSQRLSNPHTPTTSMDGTSRAAQPQLQLQLQHKASRLAGSALAHSDIKRVKQMVPGDTDSVGSHTTAQDRIATAMSRSGSDHYSSEGVLTAGTATPPQPQPQRPQSQPQQHMTQLSHAVLLALREPSIGPTGQRTDQGPGSPFRSVLQSNVMPALFHSPVGSRAGTAVSSAAQHPAVMHSLTGTLDTLPAVCATPSQLSNTEAYGWASIRTDSMLTETVYALTGGAGTVLYMAPEVAREDLYNEKSDVYSFAIVMYEVMGRSLLSANRTRAEVEYLSSRIQAGYRPRRQDGITHEGAWQLITWCWAQDPSQRPSMAQVVTRLTEIHQEMLASDAENAASTTSRFQRLRHGMLSFKSSRNTGATSTSAASVKSRTPRSTWVGEDRTSAATTIATLGIGGGAESDRDTGQGPGMGRTSLAAPSALDALLEPPRSPPQRAQCNCCVIC